MISQINCKLEQQGNIYYALVQKESEKGITFNERLFVLVEEQYIGYLSKPNVKNIQQSLNLQKLKVYVPLRCITRITVKENILTIYIQKLKNQLKWVFKMKNQEQALEWQNLIQSQATSGSQTPKISVETNKLNFRISSNIQQSSHQENIESNQIKLQGQEKIQQNQIKVKTQSQTKQNISNQHKYPKDNFNQSFDKKLNQSSQQKHKQIPSKINQQVIKVSKSFVIDQSVNKVSKSFVIDKIDQSLNKVDKPVKQSNLVLIKQNQNLLKSNSSIMKFNNEEKQQRLMRKQTKFLNYFRCTPQKIDEQKYKLFQSQAQKQFISVVKSLILTQNSQQQADLNLQYTQNAIIVTLNDITLTLPHFKPQQSLQDKSYSKILSQEYKNLDFIWYCLMASGSNLINRIFIPMCCICQYAGIIGYVKCNSFVQQKQRKMVSKKVIFDILDELSEVSRINLQILQQNQDYQVLGFDDKIIIKSLRNFLPKFGVSNSYLRKQALLQIYETRYYSNKYENDYINKHQQHQIKKINQISLAIDQIQEYIIHPIQMSQLLHKYGLNIHSLGKIHNNITNQLMKSQIQSQIVARVIKKIIKSQILTKITEQQLEGQQFYPEQYIKTILNKFLGTNSYSNSLWKEIIRQAKDKFSLSIERSKVLKGYLLMAIQHKIGLQLSVINPIDKMFQTNDYVQRVEILCKVKVFGQKFIGLCQKGKLIEPKINILHLISEKFDFHEEYFDLALTTLQISKEKLKKSLLNLKQCPSYLDSQSKEQLINYIYNFIQPGQYAQLAINLQDCPITFRYCHRQILLTKWRIKSNKNQSPEVVLRPLLDIFRVIRELYAGTAIPFFTEMHNLVEQYFLSINRPILAIHHAKLALNNLINVCSLSNTIKLADSYYQFGLCLISCLTKDWTKKQQIINNGLLSFWQPFQLQNLLSESQNSLRKAKKILQINNMLQSSQYCLIEIQLGKVLLYQGLDQQSSHSLINALQIMGQQSDLNVEQLVNCYELLVRALWQNRQKYYQISKQLLLWINNNNKSYLSDSIIQRILRIVLEGQLLSLKSHKAISNLIYYLTEVKYQGKTRKICLQKIRNWIKEKKLSQFLECNLSDRSLSELDKYQNSKEKQQLISFLSILNGIDDGYILESLSVYLNQSEER